jgi:hypothetical protein
MAGGNTNVQNMSPMMGQMQMSSLQMPGMNTVCPEQVSGTAGTCHTHTTPHHSSIAQGQSGMLYSPERTMLLFSLPVSFDNFDRLYKYKYFRLTRF